VGIVRDEEGKPVALYLPVRPPSPVPHFKRGDRVKAFAWWLWEKKGDVGDNSQFYLPATVLHFYQRDGEHLADLLFDCGRESRGHFVYGFQPVARDIVPRQSHEQREKA
jgi:hypothetical protein